MTKIIEPWKKACLATSTVLFLKNFIAGVKGETFARDRVMSVYKEICAKEMAEGMYKNSHECFLAHENEIESAKGSVLTAHNNALKKTETLITKNKDGIEQVNWGTLNTELEKYDQTVVGDAREKLTRIQEFETKTGSVLVSRSELEDILFNLEMSNLPQGETNQNFVNGYKDISKDDMKYLSGIGKEYGDILDEWDKAWKNKQVEGDFSWDKMYDSNSVEIYEDEILKQFLEAAKYKERMVGPFTVEDDKGKDYAVALIRNANGGYDWKKGSIDENNQFTQIQKTEQGETKVSYPIKTRCSFDELTIRFYESPYKGLPYYVPFPTVNGDAQIKIMKYDSAGNPKTAVIKFPLASGECDTFLYEKGKEISSIDRKETLDMAFEAIRRVSSLQDKSPGQLVSFSIKGKRGQYKIGGNYAGLEEGQCEDFMSASDCEILFQVCDPVMCPPSRFNLGGRWQVTDVVQTGVIGSIMLGMPNYPHPVLPICLPGVRAGILNYASILDAYSDCMIESAEQGTTSGICDRIRSVYICETLWKEGLAIANANGGLFDLIGQLIFKVSPQGGKEYMYFKESLAKVDDSVKWFTSTYAAPVFASFKARTGEEVGTYICKAAFYGNVPSLSSALDLLAKPESPTQFIATLEEIPYSDISETIYGQVSRSQYKLYFHIYSGEDKGVFYKVYLADPVPIPGYQSIQYYNIPGRQTSGYININDFVDETFDFEAPAGYRQVCIEIDGIAKCGFKQVTTDFGLEYLSNAYLKEQLENEVTNADECMQGTASAIPLATLPFAGTGALTEAAHGGLDKRGIVRVCDERNPGEGTNKDRWQKVGTCGKYEGVELYCWMDTLSVQGAIKDLKLINETLSRAEDNLDLIDYSKYYSSEESMSRLQELRALWLNIKSQNEQDNNPEDIKAAIGLGTDLYQKTLDSNIKAEAMLIVSHSYTAQQKLLLNTEIEAAKAELRSTIQSLFKAEDYETPQTPSEPTPTETQTGTPDTGTGAQTPTQEGTKITGETEAGSGCDKIWELGPALTIKKGESITWKEYTISLEQTYDHHTSVLSVIDKAAFLIKKGTKELDCNDGVTQFATQLIVDNKNSPEYGGADKEECQKIKFDAVRVHPWNDEFIGRIRINGEYVRREGQTNDEVGYVCNFKKDKQEILEDFKIVLKEVRAKNTGMYTAYFRQGLANENGWFNCFGGWDPDIGAVDRNTETQVMSNGEVIRKAFGLLYPDKLCNNIDFDVISKETFDDTKDEITRIYVYVTPISVAKITNQKIYTDDKWNVYFEFNIEPRETLNGNRVEVTLSGSNNKEAYKTFYINDVENSLDRTAQKLRVTKEKTKIVINQENYKWAREILTTTNPFYIKTELYVNGVKRTWAILEVSDLFPENFYRIERNDEIKVGDYTLKLTDVTAGKVFVGFLVKDKGGKIFDCYGETNSDLLYIYDNGENMWGSGTVDPECKKLKFEKVYRGTGFFLAQISII
ncbi:MAG: hypothetical protein KJ767_03350 [Nanoarchaeota archaeon]|nr:hypothetical protein [Nanoarchaeota archaeon]